jgi:BspA type Leucine rich repeat region (6 copies)
VVPASVTNIPDNAFASCTALTSVTIQGPVTNIGNSAFYGCTSLTSISLPATVSTINSTAFSNCTNLTSFTVPAATSSIVTGNAFFNCPKLTSFSVDPSNAYYSSDSSGVLFNKAKTTLIKCPEGNVNASYKVPSTVTTITDNAFYSCKNLMSITVDSSSVTFGYLPFESSNNFKNVYFTYPTPPKITLLSTFLTTAQQSTVAARYPKTTTQDASYNAVLRAAGFTSVLSYPLAKAVISAVFSDNSNNYIDISGTNFMDTATITVNGSTQPTSFNVVNNNLIVVYFQTNTQISSISVSDNFGNTSDTYQLSTPIPRI